MSARMLTRAAAPPSAAPKHCAYAAAGAWYGFVLQVRVRG